jgi:hypothetical protein
MTRLNKPDLKIGVRQMSDFVVTGGILEKSLEKSSASAKSSAKSDAKRRPVSIEEKLAQDPLYEFHGWTVCNYAGIFFMACFIVFWGIMTPNMPPIPATMTPEQTEVLVREHYNMIRLGMVLAMSTVPACYVWAVGMGKVMAKVVGKDSILIPLQVIGGLLTCMSLMVSCGYWLTMGYRPSLPGIQLMQLFDNAWMLFDLAYAVTSIQMFALSSAFLQDYREKPLIPAWLNWYGIFVGISFAAECVMPFCYDGIFARGGLFNYWFEFPIWFAWAFLFSYYCVKAIPRLKQEALTAAAAKATA